MEQQIFISHYSKDKVIADVIAKNIEKITNGNIHFWYSSDSNPKGGMCVGNIVFNEIVNHLNESVATIVLLTPRSIDRPWILFESGMAQGRENQYVIPVCVGVNRDEIKQPLNNYYCYQLSDAYSLSEFVQKLLGRLKFKKNISNEALQDFISALQDASKSLYSIRKNSKETFSNDLANEIKVHIDRRLVALTKTSENHEIKHGEAFTIPIYIGIGKHKGSREYIEIQGNDNVQNILDKIYFLLNEDVEPYTYLKSWVLRERHCGAYMILREISNLVPASCVFQSNFEWEAVEWDKKYNPSTTKFKIGLYPNW